MKTTFRCLLCQKETTRVHTAGRILRYCSRACANRAPGRMTDEIKAKIVRHGPNHPNFKGGWIGASHTGQKPYAFLWLPPEERPLHPTASGRGYIQRSHYVWDQAHPDNLVQRRQIIHHLDGDSLNDDPSNLEKMTQREHARRHFAGVPKTAEHVARQAAASNATKRAHRS